jgi:hypothetical protein
MAVPAGHRLREEWPWFVVVSDALWPAELHAHYGVCEALIGIELTDCQPHWEMLPPFESRLPSAPSNSLTEAGGATLGLDPYHVYQADDPLARRHYIYQQPTAERRRVGVRHR